jgi:hypothetical protein
MQYLECLAASLQDMSVTYQPAERMSVVLRAVVIELRGEGPVDPQLNFKLYKPNASLVPARRGSTIEEVDSPAFKRRQMNRPRAGTGPSKKRSMSMNTNVTSASLDLGILPVAGVHRFETESERSDGYVMVTPRSELVAWPSTLPQTPGLEHSLSLPSTTTTNGNIATRNAWMGAELDTSDSISQLANVHFPEMEGLEGGESMGHLDFMALGEGEWGREWNVNDNGELGVGSDLDGFPPQGTFGAMGFEGRYEMLNGIKAYSG